ncbi:4'-phosphopantetheinyl transferase superfamily protein [Trinickia sp. NRRL B-1857]|uniref:4'-phosphopantetheinyl transferase family protein n=1 Tax=Trinickia sp. NRRL B-1857 TaxID=3162879 RepID=UPI003D2822C0
MKSNSDLAGVALASADCERLHRSQVHVWYAFLSEGDAQLDADQYALLAPSERAQHSRFFFEKDRHRYLVTRALVRTILSRYADVRPKEWAFEAGQYGRPVISNPDPYARRLSFNVSHCDDLVVLAIAIDREIGIDTESTRRDAPLDLAYHYFSPREIAALRALPFGSRALRFWELWTFKESYIKARAMGLSLPLDKISFLLEQEGSVSATFDPGIEADDDRWQFWQFRPDEDHLVAICVERVADQAVRFSNWQAHPPHAAQSLQVRTTRIPYQAVAS